MTQTATRYDRYQADFVHFQKSLTNGAAWLNEMRQAGVESFSKLGFPTATRGNEDWRFTNVGPIANRQFAYPFEQAAVDAAQVKALSPWDDGWVNLVFVDGRFDQGLSTPAMNRKGPYIGNLAALSAAGQAAARQHLGRHVDAAKNGFAAVNTAFVRDGAFVALPDGAADLPPVHLVFVASRRPQPSVAYPRILVVAGRNSKATLLESYVTLADGAYFTDGVAEVILQEGAQMQHYRLMREAAEAFHIGTTHVRQEKDSTFTSISFARGAAIARNQLHVALDAPGASCFIKGLYLTDGTQHIDNNINIDHLKPHTTSDLYFKGILADRSRAVFSGRVIVHKNAQKAYALQSDKNLLLSDGARINTKPSLEIYADDVQCKHGATAGAVAEEAIFYMQARGLDVETATMYLVQGFAREVIDQIKLDGFRQYLERYFIESLPKYQFRSKK